MLLAMAKTDKTSTPLGDLAVLDSVQRRVGGANGGSRRADSR